MNRRLSFRELPEKAGGVITACIALAVVCLLVEFMGFPIADHITDAYIGNWKDTYLNSWTLYQASENLLRWPIDLGYSPIYFPTQNSFAYTIAPYGIALLSLPIYLLSGHNLIFTYNSYLLLTYPLTAWAVYRLVRYLWDAPWFAAFLPAMLVTFYPYRVGHLEHIETSTFQFLIISLYFLHRLLDTPRIGWMIGLALAFFLTYATNAYFGLFLALLLILLVGFTFFRHRTRFDRRRVALLAGFAVIALILCLPFLLFRVGMFAVDPPLATVVDRSAAVGSWLFSDSAGHNWLIDEIDALSPGLKQIVADSGLRSLDRKVSPGYAAIGLGIAGLILAARRKDGPSSGAGERLLSHRDLALAYSMVALVGFVLSFGPAIVVSHEIQIASPYRWLMTLPVFNQLRAPRRFSIMTVIALAVGCSNALRWLAMSKLSQGAKVAISVLVSAMIVAGLIPQDLALDPRPLPLAGPEYFWLAEQPAGTAVFHYPPDPDSITKVLQYQPVHHMPMLTGTGSYYPSDWYAKLVDKRVSYARMLVNPVSLESIAAHGGQYIMVHLNSMEDSDIRELWSQQEDYPADALYRLELVQSFPEAEVYTIEGHGLAP